MAKLAIDKRKVFVIALGIAAAVALYYLSTDRVGERMVEETRRLLKSQGFKTDLVEFNFKVPQEVRERASALSNQSFRITLGLTREESERRRWIEQMMPGQMVMTGTNRAIVAWREQSWLGGGGMAGIDAQRAIGNRYWELLRGVMDEDASRLNAARAAAVSGRIRYHLDATKGHGLLLPHLAPHKNLVRQLGSAAMLELHEGNKDAAWTNLLAATRMVTAWDPHPLEISAGVRFACTQAVFPIIWQALRAGWTEERLASLQGEWESLDYFKDLPETVAYSRASSANLCQRMRTEAVSFGVPASQWIRSPRLLWDGFLSYRRRESYRRQGSYEDERNILLLFRDREMAMRQAVNARSWVEMRAMAAVTNSWTFESPHSSPVKAALRTKQIMMAAYRDIGPASPMRFAGSLLARAAEAEVRRRLIVTAIALERYRLRHGKFPERLNELTPDFLADAPIDFMDGNPLRYQREKNDFMLYSVGLDGTDDRGVLTRAENRGVPREMRMGRRNENGMDLGWPFAASSEEAASYHQEQLRAHRMRMSEMEEAQSNWHWRHTSERQAEMKGWSLTRHTPAYDALKHRGRAIKDLLQSKRADGETARSLEDLLTLRRIATTNEPEVVVFEVPVNYDAATNLGSLELLIDPVGKAGFGSGYAATAYRFSRATSGHAQLTWSTIYETPGSHALQVGLLLKDWDSVEGLPDESERFIKGPLQEFTITNLCQFSPTSAEVMPWMGKTLRVKFLEPNARYAVDFVSPEGERLKRVEGSTSNGVAIIGWDLNTNDGTSWTNEFQSLIDILLPETGRTQTMRGP